MTKITILIVLYNIEPGESESVKSLGRQTSTPLNTEVLLWDNSPVAANDISASGILPGGSRYIHTPENLPLSRIYNDVIAREDFDYLILLDQDTNLPSNYLQQISDSIDSNPQISLFLPIVKNGDRLVSPGHFRLFKGSHLKNVVPGVTAAKNCLAVASGMVIAKRLFEQFRIRFDERLNFYGIDSKFMIDFARNEKLLVVLPVVLDHNSAMWSDPTADELLPRFRNLRKAWFILLSDKPIPRLMNTLYYAAKSVMFSIKFRDRRFLH